MPHFMLVLMLYINLFNLFWIKKCLNLRNMEPIKQVYVITDTVMTKKDKPMAI